MCLRKEDRRLEISYVLRLARKAALGFVMACFVARVAGVSLHLHILSHEHPEEHDAKHCPICQQLLIMPGKFITEPELSLPDSNRQKGTVEYPSQSCVITFRFEPFGPRPPPQIPVS